MKNIGLIDDKDTSRRAFRLKLDLILQKSYPGWVIIDTKPFKEKIDYRQWILENEISVLITDERLDEGKLLDGSNVNYFGSDLVIFLRDFFKDIPIYCITNIEITDQLKNSLSYFNLILSRSKFDDDRENYMNLFIKSGISFFTEFQKELGRLGVLSEKIALGLADEMDILEIQALQTRLVLPHLTDNLVTAESYLGHVEKMIYQLKELNKALEKKLK